MMIFSFAIVFDRIKVMELLFNKKLFTDSNRVDIFDEQMHIVAWSQNDFSFKNRKYLYDSLDNKVFYAQLNVKHDRVDIYDTNDKLFGNIDLSRNEFIPSFIDWKILADDNYRIVDYNGKEIMNVTIEDDNYVLNIHENKNDLNCAICLISLADYLKTKGV